MSTADNWLGSPRPPVVLHLISDLQQSAAPLRFADLEPPAQTQLVLHDVGNAAAENVFIQGAQLTTVDTRSLEVTVRGAAAKPQQRQVVLSIDGKEYARRTVELPAGAVTAPAPSVEGEGDVTRRPSSRRKRSATPSAKVLFPDLKLPAGSHRIEVALEPADALPQDDRFYAVLEHADPKALLVAPDARSDDVAYFAAAIGSLAAPRSTSKSARRKRSASGALTGYSLLVVADTSALSDIQAKRIKDYVAAGGSVLATLGTRTATSPDRCSKAGASASLSSVQLRSARSRRRIRCCARPAIGIRVRFFRHRAVQVGDDDKVLIAYEDGAPLLIERTIGAGRMLVLTTPIERELERPRDPSAVRALHRRGCALPGARRRFRRQHDRRLGGLDRIDRGRRRADIRSAGRARARPGADARRRIA